ncbi:MAG: replicative DNA helicase [Deltaproteobacteria bacterium]|nr:replicative DNA helicase [Deltaproteobacteria bacterium]
MSSPDYRDKREHREKREKSVEARIPPYSADAEAAVLGCILLNNEALFLVQNSLDEDDFYVEANRRIYGGICELSRRGLPVDHVTLGNELSQKGDLEKIGGPMALNNLTDNVATVKNVEYYAKIVTQKALVRRMIYAAQQVAAEGLSDIDDADEFLDGAEKAIFEAAKKRVGESYAPISGVLKEAFENLELAAQHSGEITGLTTGFAALDKMTAGLQASDLIIVAGRPAMGKTSFALNVAYNAAAKTGHPAIIFSLEMSKEQLVRRMLTSEGRVDANKLRSPNKLDAADWRRLTDTAGILHKVPIYLDDSAPMTPIEIRAKARRLKASRGLGLIVIDYLQLMQGSGKRQTNREQEISEISRTLKMLAKEVNVPIIALSQLNRGLESRPDKRPMMSDLRESGAIEQDADIIMFVYRDEVYHEDTEDKGIAEIIIAKQRSGPTGMCKLAFQGQYTRFENLAHDAPPDGFADGPPPFAGGDGDY